MCAILFRPRNRIKRLNSLSPALSALGHVCDLFGGRLALQELVAVRVAAKALNNVVVLLGELDIHFVEFSNAIGISLRVALLELAVQPDELIQLELRRGTVLGVH